MYPKYNSSNFDNDIALLELAQPIDFSACGQYCKPIAWINARDESLYALFGVKAWVHGWGVIRDCKQDIAACSEQEKTFEALYPSKLQQAELKIQNQGEKLRSIVWRKVHYTILNKLHQA